ncbi:MAG: FeoA family protein [Halanaerobiaceae bacterium]
MRKYTLAELPAGKTGEIVGFNGGRGFRDKIDALGIRPGKKITKISNMMLEGPVTVKVDGSRLAIGRNMAEKIVVKKN